MSEQVKKILLIEDEVPMAEMYQDKFREAGFEVDWVLTSEEALKVVKKEKPDMILLDMLLPEENGVCFLEKLRRTRKPEIAQLPVIVLSNYDDPETRKRALSLDIKAYLLKTDFTPQALVEEIQRIYTLGDSHQR